MPIDDIRELIQVLENANELKRIKAEVDANLEIAEILRRTMYQNGPALLFENVKGYDIPILGNAFGSMKRLELALETNDFTEIGKRITDITKMEIPKGVFNKIKKLGLMVGFRKENIILSAPNQSVNPEMRAEEFDKTFPHISLYVDMVK